MISRISINNNNNDNKTFYTIEYTIDERRKILSIITKSRNISLKTK